MQVILLEYPGVTGEVTLKDKAGLIACSKMKFSIKKEGDVGQPSYGDRPRRRGGSLFSMDDDIGTEVESGSDEDSAGVNSVTLDRTVDRASPKFMTLAFAKNTAEEKEAKITVYRAFERQDMLAGGLSTATASSASNIDTDASMVAWHEPFLTVTLKGVRIASHEIDVSSGDLGETIEISFKEIKLEYKVYKNGKLVGTVSGSVDVTQGTTTST
jgi:type VI protein secretion system component Hcp